MSPTIWIPSKNPFSFLRLPSLSLPKPAALHHHHSFLLNRRRTTCYFLAFLSLLACLNAFQLFFPSLLNRATHRRLHLLLQLSPPPPPPPPPPTPLSPPPPPPPPTTKTAATSFRSVNQDGTTTADFWKQPADGLRFLPCLNFSKEYYSSGGTRARTLYFMSVVSGGLNQQRIQLIDAVIMARILEAVLVIPLFQINQIWGDDSKFSDLFDEQHFKKTLREDVRVVSSLPATHLRKRRVELAGIPVNAGEEWIRTHLLPKLKGASVAIIRAFDSRLSRELKPDLQKLRCKVAFEALRFRPWIEKLGQKLSEKMEEKGPYMALHLRLEKDVWVRSGCLSGMGKAADRVIADEQASHPELLTSRIKLTPHDRYLAGACPLNAGEVLRIVKGLGVPKDTRIYWAGGEPLGGVDKALAPLTSEYQALHNKWSLPKDGEELKVIRNKPSLLAAIDYLVCLKSHLFMANNGGNMARALQGHRIYNGNGRYIRPNKRKLVPLFMNRSISESEMGKRMKQIQTEYSHPISVHTNRRRPSHDVVAYPIPDCVCVSTGIRSNHHLI